MDVLTERGGVLRDAFSGAVADPIPGIAGSSFLERTRAAPTEAQVLRAAGRPALRRGAGYFGVVSKKSVFVPMSFSVLKISGMRQRRPAPNITSNEG